MSGEVTVLLPIHRRTGNRDWLGQAIASFPAGTPYLVLENDGEVAASFNAGLQRAETEFVLPFGADDVALPGLLDRLLAPSWNADVVYPSMILVDEQLQPLVEHHAAPFCGVRLHDVNYIAGAALIRRATALRVGGYRNLPVLEDWDLWLRLHRAGARFKPCPEAQLLYRRHDQSRNQPVIADPEKLEQWRRRLIRGRWPHRRRDPLERVQATFYGSATPATTYLRCQLPARHLPALVRPDLLIADTGEAIVFPEQRGKTAVIQLASDQDAAFATVALREQGVRVLVETDDNYLASPGRQIRDRQQWGKRIRDGRRHSAEGHRWIVEQADGVIVTTDYLARQYRKLNPNVYVCPNTVDPADWPDDPWQAKPGDGVLRLHWAASLSHQDDIELVTRAFEWASRQDGVEVYVTGLKPRWQFRHGYLPWLDDLDAYRHHFAQFDIGVAPIRPTPFTLGRSDVKALEMAMGAVAPILSAVQPYAQWRDGETCLKASDAKGFLRAVQHLVRNRDEVKQIAQAARTYTLAERTTARQVHLWQEAIDG